MALANQDPQLTWTQGHLPDGRSSLGGHVRCQTWTKWPIDMDVNDLLQ